MQPHFSALLFSLLLAACARPPQQPAAPVPQHTGSTEEQMAAAEAAAADNPAAAFCRQSGGRSEIFTDPQGNDYGMCRLPDGRIYEEWEHLRQYGKQARPPRKNSRPSAS